MKLLETFPDTFSATFPDRSAYDRWMLENPAVRLVQRVSGHLSHPGEVRMVLSRYPDVASRLRAQEAGASLGLEARKSYIRIMNGSAQKKTRTKFEAFVKDLTQSKDKKFGGKIPHRDLQEKTIDLMRGIKPVKKDLTMDEQVAIWNQQMLADEAESPL